MRSALCAKKGTLLPLPTKGEEPLGVAIQCTDEIIVVVAFNSHGIRTNTLTIQNSGEFLYEVTYLGRKFKRADELVSAIIYLYSSS